MKFPRFLAVGLLPVICLRAGAAVGGDVPLPERYFPDLDAILKQAVQQSPRMLNRALDLEVAENNRIAARSNLLPSVGGYFSLYESSDDRQDLPSRERVQKIAYNFSVNQPIFYWGERKNLARIGEIQALMTKGQFREGYRLLAQELRGAYLRLIAQKLLLKRARFYLELTKGNLKQQEERLAKKVIAEAEIGAARLTAEQAGIAVERTEFDLQNAKASFARLTGGAIMSDDAIPDAIPVSTYTPAPFDQLLAGFLAQKDPAVNEASSLRHQLEIEDLNYANQKTRLKPKLNAVLGASQDQQSYTQNISQQYHLNSIYAGVSVNWAIFDGFAAGAAARNSLLHKRQLENDYRQTTERLGIDAQNQVKLIYFSARNMSIYDRFLAGGEGLWKTLQEDFKRGVKAEADVKQAQLSYYDAQYNAALARTDYLVKIGDFLGMVVEDPVLANAPVK